jgi:hypothetical protein
MDYIRRYYGVPAKRGGRVSWTTIKGVRHGTITSASNYLYVRFDDSGYTVPLHPTDPGLVYLDTPTACPEPPQ